jgi:hypothetical protein
MPRERRRQSINEIRSRPLAKAEKPGAIYCARLRGGSVIKVGRSNSCERRRKEHERCLDMEWFEELMQTEYCHKLGEYRLYSGLLTFLGRASRT